MALTGNFDLQEGIPDHYQVEDSLGRLQVGPLLASGQLLLVPHDASPDHDINNYKYKKKHHIELDVSC